TTEMAWVGRHKIEGMGAVGNGSYKNQGFHLHSVLALKWPGLDKIKAAETETETETENSRPPVELIGLLDQQYYVRTRKRKSKKPHYAASRKAEASESQLWEQAGQRIGAAPQQENVTWIRICDRGADI